MCLGIATFSSSNWEYLFPPYLCNISWSAAVPVNRCKKVHACFGLFGCFRDGVMKIGWRIGWAIAPASITSAIRNIHIKITDSAPAPFQEAALTALDSPTQYFESLRLVRKICLSLLILWMSINCKNEFTSLTTLPVHTQDYESRRDFIVELLAEVGLCIQFKPQGSIFLFAELPEKCLLSDVWPFPLIYFQYIVI